MTPIIPNREPDQNGTPKANSEACAEAQAEMHANYPHFKQAIYASLREEFERELPPLPDADLEAYAAEHDAKPLEAFIEELERPAEGS